MKRWLTVVILFTMALSGCRINKTIPPNRSVDGNLTDIQASVNYMEPSTWLLGYINPDRFSRPPHSDWYLKGFEAYHPVKEVIDKLALSDKENLSITIVMGTWCPDSRREVPHFMKIIDQWKFPHEMLIFIGVDNTKIAPIGGYDTLGIERVPTFIFIHNKVEIGRIIENPVTSLEQDMLNILTRNEK